jgi:tetratricopeptide (TPR) repeat protein
MSLWPWLKRAKNQKTLTLIGGGVVGFVLLISTLMSTLVEMGVVGNAAMVAGNGQVSTDDQAATISVHVGGTGNTVTTAGRDQYIGIPPDQLPAILAAARGDWNALTDEQRAIVSSLEGRLGGVPQKAILAFLKAIGETQVPMEQVETRLLEIAENYLRALSQAAPGPGDTPAIIGLKANVRAALEAGELELADKLLERLLALEDAAIEERLIQAAKTAAQRGTVAMARLRYREAADHYQSAAKRIGSANGDDAINYLMLAVNALHLQGADFGDKAALDDAITKLRDLLTMGTHEREPLKSARIQNELGNALKARGMLEDGNEGALGGGGPRKKDKWLREAIVAFRAALEEYTHERMPLNWAATQNNLGNALLALGWEEIGTERIEEAVLAFRAALKEYTHERMPRNWAITQNNLGNALLNLGLREGGTKRIEEAVLAFRAALEELTHKRDPRNWAAAQYNLGNALLNLGLREGETKRIEEAVLAFRAALKEYTHERMPRNWAMTQYNLGNALLNLGLRESGIERLEEAILAYRAALDFLDTAGPMMQAMFANINLAKAQTILAERSKS